MAFKDLFVQKENPYKVNKNAEYEKVKDLLINYYRDGYQEALGNIQIPEEYFYVASYPKGRFRWKTWVSDGILYMVEDLDHKINALNDESVLPHRRNYDNSFIDWKKGITTTTYVEVIPIENIHFFDKLEKSETITRTTGGGYSPSLTRMAAGLFIGGTAGAILGSIPKEKAVKTETEQLDIKLASLEWKYQENGKWIEDGRCYTIEAYDVFKKLIPEKEHGRVMKRKKAEERKAQEQREKQWEKLTQRNMPKPADPVKVAREKLMELRKLVNEGLITQEEYDAKKKQILKKI